MADPLSVAGSAVGLISLGFQVTQSLVNFYNSYKGREDDIMHMREKLDGLLVILQSVETTLSGRKFHVDERSLVQSIETSIKGCDEMIQELQHEFQKISKSSSDGLRAPCRNSTRILRSYVLISRLRWTCYSSRTIKECRTISLQ